MLNPTLEESLVTSLGENRNNEQYFFTPETVENLAKVSAGNVACLCTPTVAESLLNKGKKDVVVFDIDPRLKDLAPFRIHQLPDGLELPDIFGLVG